MLESIGPGGHPAGDRWLHCYIEESVWHGTGDETCLKQIIEIFLDWAENTNP